MAVAGKVAITLSTENGGAWSADVTYDRLVAVKHNNNLYISRKTVANVEPPNDEFWFLAMEGFSGEDIENIINGTTQVGNAKTLDGHGAEYFATVEELTNHTVPVYTVNNEEELLNKLAEIHANAKDNSSYEVKLNIRYSGEPLSRGGSWSVQGFRHYTDYGWQSFSHYSGDALLKVRVLANNTWSKVYTFATLSDLANYLPLTGGKSFRLQDIANAREALCGLVDGTLYFRHIVNDSNYKEIIINSTGARFQEAINGVLKGYNLLHTGNKPTGTYTGNGSATARTIATGGIGSCVMVRKSGERGVFAIVTESGYYAKDGSNGEDAYFASGVLTIASTSNAFNTNGATYYYQVL